jgi:hypothetical protein
MTYPGHQSDYSAASAEKAQWTFQLRQIRANSDQKMHCRLGATDQGGGKRRSVTLFCHYRVGGLDYLLKRREF